MNKVKAWVLIILSYMCTFLTPVVSAFLLLADDVYKETSKGGFLFYLVLTITLVAFSVYLLRLINAQKANHFKTLFKGGLYMAVMWLFLSVLDYVTFNIEQLGTVVYLSMGGYALGMLFKTLAIQKHYNYVRELGVF